MIEMIQKYKIEYNKSDGFTGFRDDEGWHSSRIVELTPWQGRHGDGLSVRIFDIVDDGTKLKEVHIFDREIYVDHNGAYDGISMSYDKQVMLSALARGEVHDKSAVAMMNILYVVMCHLNPNGIERWLGGVCVKGVSNEIKGGDDAVRV